MKPSIVEMEALLAEGRESIVDCSYELKKLEQEKEEVIIWCSTLEEWERSISTQLSLKERVNRCPIATADKIEEE